MRTFKRIALPLLASVAVVSGCSGGGEPVDAPTTAGTTSATTASAAVTATTPALAAADAPVCGSLGQVGRAFYEGSYSDLMKTQSTTVDPIQLAAQLSALTTVGAPPGSINGAAAIAAASPAVSVALITLTRDADRIAQRYIGVAQGAVTGSDVTPIIDSFTEALIACTRAGYQPIWFDPAALLTT